MLLAAAKHFSRHRNFDGTVYLVFQPAEEGGGGAREMIREGLFDAFSMEAIFGAHNWPGMKVGQFAIKSGPCFASSSESRSRSAARARTPRCRTGSRSVPVACQMVQAFQTIVSRNARSDPIRRDLVSTIHGAKTTNVMPATCVLTGPCARSRTEVAGP